MLIYIYASTESYREFEVDTKIKLHIKTTDIPQKGTSSVESFVKDKC